MHYKAIIFDMDGTTIDTEHIWHEATVQLLGKRGITLTIEQMTQLKIKLAGKGTLDCCIIIKQELGLQDEAKALAQEKSLIANELYTKDLKFVAGFEQFHAKAKRHNLKIALATNAQDHTLHIAKTKLNLTLYFGDHLYNISHVNNVYKPHPAIYLHAAKQLDIVPQQCIAIEDSPSGIKAAKDAGMYCIGINTAKNPESLSQAHQIIDHYDEIDLFKLLHRKKQ